MSKRKKIIITLCAIFALMIGVLYYLFYSINIYIIGNNEIDLGYKQKYFENGYIVKIFNKETDKIKVIVKDNINSEILGDYHVEYKLDLPISKSIKRTVHVVDNLAPVITLNGNKNVCVSSADEYVELGATAIDNYDGDISNSIRIEGSIENTPGTYELTYIISDSKGNFTNTKRTIEVVDETILNASISEFWLKGYYDDIVLKEQETENDFFNDIVFLGDSNFIYLWYRGHLMNAEQSWGRWNMTFDQINNSKFWRLADDVTITNMVERTFNETMDKFKPKYLIITPGLGSAGMSKDNFVSAIENFINNMEENYSDVKYAFSCIFPVCKNSSVGGAMQDGINKKNYYLLKTCYKHNVNCINFTDELRGADGYGNNNYYTFNDDEKGFHLNQTGREMYINHIKHLNFERIIEE